MTDYAHAKQISKVISALAEPTRMMVIEFLAHQPHHVSELADVVGIPIVNMSHHLGVLRQAGIVEDTREGRKKIYTLSTDYFKTGGQNQLGQFTIGKWTLSLTGFGIAGKKGKKKSAG